MQKKQKRNKSDDYCNIDEIKAYMAFSAKEKLDFLEEANAFFNKIMPAKSKTIWKKLQQLGW